MCFKARVLQEYFKGTLGMFQGCFEYLKGVCEIVLRVNISRVLEFTSSVFQRCFRVFQGFFKSVACHTFFALLRPFFI